MEWNFKMDKNKMKRDKEAKFKLALRDHRKKLEAVAQSKQRDKREKNRLKSGRQTKARFY